MITLIVITAIAAFIVGVLLYAASQPDSFHVERSTYIQASPQQIYPFIEDLHLWGAWSPYEKLDPSMQRSYSGALRGTGAVYEWDANKKIGAGRMEIIACSPASHVIVELDYFRPFKGHNIAEFSLWTRGRSTEVRWEVDGPAAFIGKFMGLFIDMDKLIGGEFEKGLANLKNLAEEPQSVRGYWSSGTGARDAARLSASQAA